MADKYINKTELLFEMTTSLIPQDVDTIRGYAIAKDLIKNAPAADVAPVRHGEWVKEHNRIGDDDYQCSHCKGYACESGSGFYDVLTDYCPNCGARMDGGNK